MIVKPTSLPGVLRITPTIYEDSRGFFMETWHSSKLADAGIHASFVQGNFSHSTKGTLRGLHYQVDRPQGRLVRVVYGEILDVTVDLRRSSPFFGRWTSELLSGDNRHQLWVPPGFGHGFLTLTDTAGFEYSCSDIYSPEGDRSVRWNDPDIGVDWSLNENEAPNLSAKDATAPFLKDAEVYE